MITNYTTTPTGWSCPHCGKAHAPDVKTCPEPVVADCWPPVTRPLCGDPVTACGDTIMGGFVPYGGRGGG